MVTHSVGNGGGLLVLEESFEQRPKVKGSNGTREWTSASGADRPGGSCSWVSCLGRESEVEQSVGFQDVLFTGSAELFLGDSRFPGRLLVYDWAPGRRPNITDF